MQISRSLSPARSAYGIVSYHGIPLWRCQAWALELARYHGGYVVLLSGIRSDDVIAAHNHQFGTHLHGQAWCVRMHAVDPLHYAPANSPQTTSHCGHADGNPFYGPVGHVLPKVKWGIDAYNAKVAEDLVRVLRSIGIPAACPYDTGSELHHFSIGNADVGKLRRRYAKIWARGFRP